MANKIQFEVLDVIEKDRKLRTIREFPYGKGKCFKTVSREYATQSRQGFTRLRVAGQVDAMINFSTPLRGQQVLTPLGSEQTTSLLVVLIIFCKACSTASGPEIGFRLGAGFLHGKVEDAGELTPAKDDNAAMRKSRPRTGSIPGWMEQ